MKAFLLTAKRILLWSYERGTWQYDVLCLLILAFIFLTPTDCFHSHPEPRQETVERPQAPAATSIRGETPGQDATQVEPTKPSENEK